MTPDEYARQVDYYVRMESLERTWRKAMANPDPLHDQIPILRDIIDRAARTTINALQGGLLTDAAVHLLRAALATLDEFNATYVPDPTEPPIPPIPSEPPKPKATRKRATKNGASLTTQPRTRPPRKRATQ